MLRTHQNLSREMFKKFSGEFAPASDPSRLLLDYQFLAIPQLQNIFFQFKTLTYDNGLFLHCSNNIIYMYIQIIIPYFKYIYMYNVFGTMEV